MARRCGVCGDPRREELDEILRGKVNMLKLARDYGITRDVLTRHRDNHVRLANATPLRLVSPEEGESKRSKAPIGDPQTAFLTAYAATCDITQGLKAALITRTQLREWQETDETFALRFNQAEVEAVESLEYEARIRAIAGSKLVRRVYRGGVLYEEIHEFRPSDAMMIKLLQAAKPERYGERLTLTQTTILKALDAQAWESV